MVSNYYKMLQYILIFATVWVARAADLPPTCNRPVYCDSKLLHHVQLAKIYEDSKTFVDLEMKYDENKTLTDFNQLLIDTDEKPSREEIQKFVDDYFSSVGELEDWIPSDFTNDPHFIRKIKDKQLRQFAKNINNIWPNISRKVKDVVFENPERFSLIPVPNGFIIPGGRFKEIYYWDTYWIIEGLLISGMQKTARGVIENLIALLKLLGHIPNGSRWYYQQRSQPPMLSDMMAIYYEYTNDLQFIRDNVEALEKEVEYWLNTQAITFEKDNQTYNLLRYYAPSSGPRPESYREDYENAQKLNEDERTDFYIDIKSAAESGWDFSTRWFIAKDGSNNGSLTDIKTTNIIPVDLNAIFAGVLQNTANFNALLHKRRKSRRYRQLAGQWRNAIQAVLWDDESGIWFDYDIVEKTHRKYFYTSNVAPLWQGAVSKEFVILNGPRVISYLQDTSGLQYPGGVPTSLIHSGEQWDFPNVWPPEVSIVVNALEAIKTKEAQRLAFEVAQTFVRSCHKGFTEHNQMFEKYDAVNPGQFGGGGEYKVQLGFGWSNGAVLEFLNKYGSILSVDDSHSNASNAKNK